MVASTDLVTPGATTTHPPTQMETSQPTAAVATPPHDSLSLGKQPKWCLVRLLLSVEAKIRSLLAHLQKQLGRIIGTGESPPAPGKKVSVNEMELPARTRPPQLRRTGPNICWIDSALQMLFASPELFKTAIRYTMKKERPELAQELLRLASSDKEVEGIEASIFFKAFPDMIASNHTGDAKELLSSGLLEDLKPIPVSLSGAVSKEELEKQATEVYQMFFPEGSAPQDHLLLNLFKSSGLDETVKLPIPENGGYEIAGDHYQIVSAILYLSRYSPVHLTAVTSYPDPKNPTIRHYYYCDDLQGHLPREITREEFDQKIEKNGYFIHLQKVKS